MGVAEYIQGTRAELRHVSWPTRRQVVVFTATVVALSLVVAGFLGIFDYLFSQALEQIIRSDRSPVSVPLDGGGLDGLDIQSEPAGESGEGSLPGGFGPTFSTQPAPEGVE